jgi:hypothetical protein
MASTNADAFELHVMLYLEFFGSSVGLCIQSRHHWSASMLPVESTSAVCWLDHQCPTQASGRLTRNEILWKRFHRQSRQSLGLIENEKGPAISKGINNVSCTGT